MDDHNPITDPQGLAENLISAFLCILILPIGIICCLFALSQLLMHL